MKYKIEKLDGTPISPEAVYFVLRLDNITPEGTAARNALHMYAELAKHSDFDAAMAAMNAVAKGFTNARSKGTIKEKGYGIVLPAPSAPDQPCPVRLERNPSS